MSTPSPPVDALLLVSFGGPEGPDDVLPFLRRVTAGRGVPDERLAVVAAQYDRVGGVSPINEQNRRLQAALEQALAARGDELPVYWGNRNWHPLLADTVATMAEDGIARAAAFVTSAYRSHSGCRQYLGDIEAARQQVGPGAPVIEKLRTFHDHPGFVEPFVDATRAALASLGTVGDRAELVFCAHSLPVAMAAGCDYTAQLTETAALVADAVGGGHATSMAFQSRSGPPQVPWLEPDIADHLRSRSAAGAEAVVIVPIGFVSDHMEVVNDLDVDAAAVAAELDLPLARAATPGTDGRFVAMVLELLDELQGGPARALGAEPPRVGPCPDDCCPSGRRGENHH